jgi:hypothetical protein
VDLAKDGFDIVYDRSYPVLQMDMREIITEAKQLNPDVFVSFSYPPDTMARRGGGGAGLGGLGSQRPGEHRLSEASPRSDRPGT